METLKIGKGLAIVADSRSQFEEQVETERQKQAKRGPAQKQEVIRDEPRPNDCEAGSEVDGIGQEKTRKASEAVRSNIGCYLFDPYPSYPATDLDETFKRVTKTMMAELEPGHSDKDCIQLAAPTSKDFPLQAVLY